MEYPAANLFQNALREIKPKKEVKRNQLVLTEILVAQRLSHCLRLCGLLRQAFHPASVSSNLRTHSQRQHVYLCRGTYLHLEQFDILYLRDIVSDCSMHSTQENLEPIDDEWPLLQLRC